MLNFVLFILFGLGIFFLSLIGYKKHHTTTLYALAIGGIVNANFFHAAAYPIVCLGLPFGIDSIIYTLFAFCVIVTLLKEDKRAAYLLAISSIVAILFSAAMQLIAELFTLSSSWTVWSTFLSFVASAFASTVAIAVAIEIVDKIKNKTNAYVVMFVGIAIITLLNSGIYYPLLTLMNMAPENIMLYLMTSLLGKGIALLCALLTLFLMRRYEKYSKK